jgi:Leucine-rich repeat (LRR) protein
MYDRLHFNRLSGAIPSSLADARALRTLSLSENALTGRVPAALGTLPKLSKLLLGSNRLSGRVPWELTNLAPTLTDLLLSGNPALEPDTPAARDRRRRQLPNCRISM